MRRARPHAGGRALRSWFGQWRSLLLRCGLRRDGQLDDRAIAELLAGLARLREDGVLGLLRLQVPDLHLAAPGVHARARLVELLAGHLRNDALLLGLLGLRRGGRRL